jgi:hypothetical protein
MAPTNPAPFFAAPPAVYDQRYFAQVTRAFSVFVQQTRNPGPTVASALRLTNLAIYASNAAAVAGGLSVDDVYKTATGELRIVV